MAAANARLDLAAIIRASVANIPCCVTVGVRLVGIINAGAVVLIVRNAIVIAFTDVCADCNIINSKGVVPCLIIIPVVPGDVEIGAGGDCCAQRGEVNRPADYTAVRSVIAVKLITVTLTRASLLINEGKEVKTVQTDKSGTRTKAYVYPEFLGFVFRLAFVVSPLFTGIRQAQFSEFYSRVVGQGNLCCTVAAVGCAHRTDRAFACAAFAVIIAGALYPAVAVVHYQSCVIDSAAGRNTILCRTVWPVNPIRRSGSTVRPHRIEVLAVIPRE